MTIAYYVTAHGYGHGVRSCDIIRALNELQPDLPVEITSDLPESFFKNRLPPAGNRHRPGSLDVGMVQIDSIRMDIAESLKRAESLLGEWNSLLKRERRYLVESGAGLVVSDIPAIPLEAASELGIPCIAVGNFSWDWIYSAYAANDERWSPIVETFRRGYSKADLLLRLPLSDEMTAFPKRIDVPAVASPGRDRRADIARLCGCSPQKQWILLSFTTLEWDEPALANVERLDEYEFFTVLPLEWRGKNIYPIDRESVAFSDILASMDAVVAKPGFGIISDCAVNRKPMIYADRSDFLEYPILVESIQKYLRNVHIPAGKLYRGELADALQAIRRSPEPAQSLPAGGAQVAAGHLLRVFERMKIHF